MKRETIDAYLGHLKARPETFTSEGETVNVADIAAELEKLLPKRAVKAS